MRRATTLYLVIGVILLASMLPICAGEADSPNVSSTAPGDYDLAADFSAATAAGPLAYGTNVWWTDQDADLWTARWPELGPSQVRLFVSHAVIEPENDNTAPDVIDWDGFGFETPIPITTTRTATYRYWFEALRDQPNLDILIHFSYLAPWLTDNPPHEEYLFQVAPYPPNDLAEYREFVEATLRYLVETVNFPPERIAIEAMNEPDLGCDVDPVVPCFWQNWTMADIADVVRVTHEAIQAVDADIALVGLAECCGTGVVRNLLNNYPVEGSYLDGLSYHYYAQGYNLDAALNRAATLAPYNLPIYLDEYGSRQYLSEGTGGALWHSWALATLYEAGIAPLQYPISEWPLQGEPYNSMGLFEDWRGDWARKPSYWTYVNFFRFVGGGEIISHTAPSELDVLTTRQIVTGGVQAAFWVVNRGSVALIDRPFVLYNFPEQGATLRIYDNTIGPTPTLTTTVSGSPLVFTATLPAHSSHVFVLSGERSHGPLNHVALAPDLALRIAGQTISYTLTAYDDWSNSWDVTISGTYTSSWGAGGYWTDNSYTTEITGTWIVTGAYGDQSDTTALTVWIPTTHLYLPLVLRDYGQ